MAWRCSYQNFPSTLKTNLSAMDILDYTSPHSYSPKAELVAKSMFDHSLREKSLTTIDISRSVQISSLNQTNVIHNIYLPHERSIIITVEKKESDSSLYPSIIGC
ncbi:hypothetical protein RF11_10051 [Thelohanellus kitauei]|uniref:Uncharacterized protein n=1 Tax=Thelohanellus kitauei TaxID=669202 RepID=A0A0C2J978_THEKT|nr:hypothetical protein RF11_10051 [Thelohanellus kitauei]